MHARERCRGAARGQFEPPVRFHGPKTEMSQARSLVEILAVRANHLLIPVERILRLAVQVAVAVVIEVDACKTIKLTVRVGYATNGGAALQARTTNWLTDY